jgi:hypothetical protein
MTRTEAPLLIVLFVTVVPTDAAWDIGLAQPIAFIRAACRAEHDLTHLTLSTLTRSVVPLTP